MAREFWMARARRVAWRVNAAWWLGAFLPMAFGASILASGAALLARREGWPLVLVLSGYAVVLLLAAWLALRRTRSRYFSVDDGLVRLDVAAGLDNRLTSAAEGVGSWPAPATDVEGRLDWRKAPVAGPLAACLALWLAAFLIPISASTLVTPPPSLEPLVWSDLEETLERLARVDFLEPEPVERLQEQLEALRRQPSEDWYGHASLEASDSLEQRVDHALAELAANLSRSARASSSLEGIDAASPDLEKLAVEWGEARRQLEFAALAPSSELLGELRRVDPRDAGSTRPGERTELGERLEGVARRAAECRSGSGSEAGSPGSAQLAQGGGGTRAGAGRQPAGGPAPAQHGAGGEASGSGPSGSGSGATPPSTDAVAGSGGTTRGPGSAPLQLGEVRELARDLGSSRLEGLEGARDDSRPSDTLVGVVVRAPEVEPGSVRPELAGGILTPGRGGEAVWRQQLPPREQQILQRYFQ